MAPALVDAHGVPALPGSGWVGTGSALSRHAWLRDAWHGAMEGEVEGDLPRASAIARLGARLYAKGGAVPAEQAAPLYLRDKVALTTEERQARH
jgi:tRNA threonylcarbamoyladenosine biosynthesis protein TsaB